MDISYLSDYMIPVIVGLCLCVGYVTKKWVKDVDNKFIPTLCAALGVALACWASWPAIDAGTILAGMVSGLASTGLHQAFKQLVGAITEPERSKRPSRTGGPFLLLR